MNDSSEPQIGGGWASPSWSENHDYFMRRALREAEIALEEGEVPVGAVVVREGRVIGRGHNQRETLKDPAKRARYERIALGRFSMMISAILTLIIATPFYATREPKNMVIQSIRCAPIAIITLIAGVIGATASIPGLPTTIGVFIPVMILSVVAVAQFSALKT